MNDNQVNPNNLLDTTDCLEAVGVFRGWKNFFFVIVILCLLLLQACFWLIETGFIPVTQDTTAPAPQTCSMAIVKQTESEQPALASEGISEQVQEAVEPAEQVVAEPNIPAEPNQPVEPNLPVDPNLPAEPNQSAVPSPPAEAPQPEEPEAAVTVIEPPPTIGRIAKDFLFGIKFEHLTWLISFVNAVLILTATLYCLTMLFSLKVSMLGRLGGINHISRAFFLSLLMLVLLLPWQIIFSNVVTGAIFTPSELLKWHFSEMDSLFDIILYYLRFSGYWLLILLLLIFSQIRSSRWAKAILRRLEVM